MKDTVLDRPTVLVVEDELIVATDLEASLRQLGYTVLGIAETGTEAVWFAEHNEPDLVIMDIRLQGPVDGIAAAQDIRQRLDIPIVFLTAYASRDIIERALEAQPFGYLTKPFRPDELNATLKMALLQHRIATDLFATNDWLKTLIADGNEKEAKAGAGALGQTRVELGALAAHLLTTLEEERRHIARELHDDLSHRTAIVDLWANVVQKLLPDASTEVHDAIHHLSSNARELTHALNHMSRQMHPSIIEDLGLGPAVRHVVDEHQRHEGTVELTLRALPSDIPREIGFVIYRILQEALRNVRRHTENAPVHVSLHVNARELHLIIEDEGPGFDLQKERGKGGVGLVSMHERARLVGGDFSIKTAPGQGARIDVRIPLRDVD